MNSLLLVVFAVFGLTWAVIAGQQAGEQRPSEPSHSATISTQHEPMHHGPAMKVEFENDAVQVFRVVIAPHQKIPMHDIATPRVQVLLTDEHLRITLPNGETREVRHKAGEVGWLEPQKHAGENLSDSPLEFVTVVPKR